MINDIIKAGLGPEIKIYNESTVTKMVENEEDSTLNDTSLADVPVDYNGYIQDAAFMGEYPFSVLIEGIRNQFANYIATDDRTNYVDIFYNQYHNSYRLAEEEDFPSDVRDVLESYVDQFESVMYELFSGKLAITLSDLDGDLQNRDSTEDAIRKLYEFFILRARENFKYVIARNSYKDIDSNLEDRLYYSRIREILAEYSPIVMNLGPEEFLKYCQYSEDVITLFDMGRVSGNFLRKYSPRLYQNEDYECEIIAFITSIIELFKETNDISEAIKRKEEEEHAAE